MRGPFWPALGLGCAAVCLVGLSCRSCEKAPAPAASQQESAQSVKRGPWFEVPASQREHLLAVVCTLKAGDSAGHVIAVMGPPTDRSPWAAVGGPLRGQIWDYQMRQWYRDEGNLQLDESIMIAIDSSERLVSVAVQVDGEEKWLVGEPK